jgi:Trp operon repressor
MYKESLDESNISENQERYQIALQLAEQKYQMEAIGEILQVILTNLRQRPDSPDNSKQLQIIQALLVDMDSYPC